MFNACISRSLSFNWDLRDIMDLVLDWMRDGMSLFDEVKDCIVNVKVSIWDL